MVLPLILFAKKNRQSQQGDIFPSKHYFCQEHAYISKLSSRSWDFQEFPISRQLSPARKNIFTGPIRKFLGVLKSYESESFESRVLVPWVKFGVPSGTHPSGEFWENSNMSFAPPYLVTETCFLEVLGSIHNVNLFERAKLCRSPSLEIKLKY